MDTYSMMQGHCVPGVVTGKPVAIGGASGRVEATGRGVAFTVNNILSALEIEKEGAKVVIQGMGNVGSIAAKLLFEQGYRILAVSDVSGGIYKEDGLDIPDILAYLKANPKALLKDYNGTGIRRITNEELLELETTVLIPAALENQINVKNADAIKAKVIVDAANGPTTVEADAVLDKKGIVVVPDILSNAGGVIVSYFEWVQNIQALTWGEEEVNGKLKTILDQSFASVWNIAKEKNTSLRTGAYLIAVKRVVEAEKIRSIWP